MSGLPFFFVKIKLNLSDKVISNNPIYSLPTNQDMHGSEVHQDACKWQHLQ